MGLLEKKNNYKLRAQDHNKKRRSYSSLVKSFLLPHDQLQEGRLVAQEEYPGHRPDGGAGDLNANPGPSNKQKQRRLFCQFDGLETIACLYNVVRQTELGFVSVGLPQKLKSSKS